MNLLVLDRADFDLLGEAPDGAIPDSDYTLAVAAFDEGKLVGRMFLVALPHLEAPWIREDKRGGTLGARMEAMLVKRAEHFGLKRTFAFAVNEEIEDYLKRLGYEKTGYTVWEKNNAGNI